jgi:hypothetical protein
LHLSNLFLQNINFILMGRQWDYVKFLLLIIQHNTGIYNTEYNKLTV